MNSFTDDIFKYVIIPFLTFEDMVEMTRTSKHYKETVDVEIKYLLSKLDDEPFFDCILFQDCICNYTYYEFKSRLSNNMNIFLKNVLAYYNNTWVEDEISIYQLFNYINDNRFKKITKQSAYKQDMEMFLNMCNLQDNDINREFNYGMYVFLDESDCDILLNWNKFEHATQLLDILLKFPIIDDIHKIISYRMCESCDLLFPDNSYTLYPSENHSKIGRAHV
jgi:hypothetical protein